jgi:hypothetical protein
VGRDKAARNLDGSDDPAKTLISMAKLLAVLAAVILLSCASTDTQSSTYKSQISKGQEFWKVAVWAKAGLAVRQQTEAAAVAALRAERIDAFASLDVWAIDSSETEMRAKLSARGIDAVLVLALDQASSTVSSVGTVSTTALWGNTTVTNTAVTAQTRDNAVYSATLYNEGSGRVVWQSQAFTSGNEYAGWNDIRNSFISKTAADFLAAHVMYLCALPPAPLPDASQHYKELYAQRVATQKPGDCPPQPPVAAQQ